MNIKLFQEQETCPKCFKSRLISKTGRHGKFLGCGRYPVCTFTADVGLNLEREATRLLKKRRK